MTTIIGLKIKDRNNSAAKIQKVFTKYGCIINTRLGLHDKTQDCCSPFGLILLEIIDDVKAVDFIQELCKLKDIEFQKMVF